ncbi:NADH-quinone oxidoreductase subunit L [Myxococcota bacterium]|nr:NADH-quinone oxidoreductase subunit L [Myxococcota bacterium]
MQTATYETLYLIPLLPLIGAALLGIFGTKLPKDLVSTVALSTVLGSFAITVFATIFLVKGGVPLENVVAQWISVGRYKFDLVFGLDQLSATLMLVVTGVGFLIHVYSVGYMHDDPAYARYFAYLNLFIFAMSVLVLGRSMPVMFVGWEGVGLASYLLIGFWYTDEDKAKAGKKAFITNRIGDFGFLIGIFTLVGLFGTADFAELKQAVAAIKSTDTVLTAGMFSGYTIGAVVTAACLALFVGATGKSAQIPLFVWLPDAMAGPTPVSALIHAATMVTAGVYMVCRLHFLFDLAPIAQEVVAWTGAATALLAATIGLAQNDIKKVLAYSTVSQLGYMFLGAGVGAYSAAFFHVVTHAFFKACLFLGSGAVIHALYGEQDMRKMGGLRTELPWVWRTFIVSTLALAGVAPLSGFFSKDAILANAFEESPALWAMGFAGAGLTALYMMRLVCLTFFGKLRIEDGKDAHGHDAHGSHGHGHGAHGHGHFHVHAPGAAMVVPLVILALLATIAGLANLPVVFEHVSHSVGLPHGWFDAWLAPSVGTKAATLSHSAEWGLLGASLAMALVGLSIGYAIFKNGPSTMMEGLVKSGPMKLVHTLLDRKWFVDEIYQAIVITPLRFISSAFAVFIDPWLIDGVAVKGSGYSVFGVGRVISKLQTGNVQSYAAVFVIAMAAIILWAVQ